MLVYERLYQKLTAFSTPWPGICLTGICVANRTDAAFKHGAHQDAGSASAGGTSWLDDKLSSRMTNAFAKVGRITGRFQSGPQTTTVWIERKQRENLKRSERRAP